MRRKVTVRKTGWKFEIEARIRYGGRVWKIGMLGYTEGEAYYWLHRPGEVAMLPRGVVEGVAVPA